MRDTRWGGKELKPEIALDEDEEPARLAARVEPDPRDVLDHRVELAGGVCVRARREK